MKHRLPVIIALVTLAGISLPMIQQLTGFMHVSGLAGVTTADTTRPEYSWWDGSLQKQLERNATDSLLLQPACVRLRNQLEYTFFDKLNAHDIYLHQGIFFRYNSPGYNEEAVFVGKEKVREHVRLIQQFQQYLLNRRDSIPLYVIIPPSKLWYYREALPEINRSDAPLTNYACYKRALLQAGINVLDANSWFLSEKETTPVPYMATGGVHWTLYGAAKTLDSLIRRINSERHAHYQEVILRVSETYEVYPEDMDVVKLCNLMFPPEDKRLRNVYFPEPKDRKQRLRPLIISDSFFNIIDWTPLHDQVLDPATAFYYYFHTRSTHTGEQGPVTGHDIVDKDLAQADAVIFIVDIQNMERFGFGFPEKYISQLPYKKTPAR